MCRRVLQSDILIILTPILIRISILILIPILILILYPCPYPLPYPFPNPRPNAKGPPLGLFIVRMLARGRLSGERGGPASIQRTQSVRPKVSTSGLPYVFAWWPRIVTTTTEIPRLPIKCLGCECVVAWRLNVRVIKARLLFLRSWILRFEKNAPLYSLSHNGWLKGDVIERLVKAICFLFRIPSRKKQ